MPIIEMRTEIAASPDKVRRIFLDFPKCLTWHSGDYIKSVTPVTASSGVALKSGDKVACEMGGVQFEALVEENSPDLLRWQGPPISTISGCHTFHFTPSIITPGCTTFIQHEEFTGLLSFLLGAWSPLGKSVRKQWEGLAADLKKCAEAK